MTTTFPLHEVNRDTPRILSYYTFFLIFRDSIAGCQTREELSPADLGIAPSVAAGAIEPVLERFLRQSTGELAPLITVSTQAAKPS